jgi:hypothetical protein
MTMSKDPFLKGEAPPEDERELRTEQGVVLPAQAGDQVVVPEVEQSVLLPSLAEVAKVVTGSAETGELQGLVRPWRKGDPVWAILVNDVAYARVDGLPVDTDTMWKAGYRPPFRFKKMAPGGWKPNETFIKPDGSVGIKSKREWTRGGWSWGDTGPEMEEHEERLMRKAAEGDEGADDD